MNKQSFEDIVPLPKRRVGDQWQIMLDDGWENVASLGDAYNLGIAFPLAKAVVEGRIAGDAVAAQLDLSAEAWQLHHEGKSSFVHRCCTYASEVARGMQTVD